MRRTVRGNANCITRACGEGFDEVGQGQDADAAQSELRRDFLHRRLGALAAFLAVERQRHARGRRAGRADDFHGFADGGAGRDHVIDDHDAAAQRRADDVAAFAVILGFLAIERPRHAAMVVLGERHGGGGGERDALVRRPEQHVELEARARERRGVTLAEHRDGFAVVEQAGVEEVGTLAAGLELEAAEAQRVARHGEVDEGSLILLHGQRLPYDAAVRMITPNRRHNFRSAWPLKRRLAAVGVRRCASTANGRVLSMLFLGVLRRPAFLSRVPTLSAWLRTEHIERATIGMLSWVGLMYSFKWVWAPVVDRCSAARGSTDC